MTTTAYLSDDQFAARTMMAPSAVERLQGVSFDGRVADSLAADATPETPTGVVKYAGNVVAVRFYPDLSLAADPANYATISVYKRAADGSQTLIASVDTSARGWTNGVPVVFTLASAPVALDDTLTYAITKHGTGVVVPTGRFVVKLDQNFLTVRLLSNTAYIEARLRKRYAVPFVAPVPETVLKWLTDMTTKDAFDRLGRNPTSGEDQAAIDTPAATAVAEIKEAADSQNGLFDLPLVDGGASGVSAGGPLAYHEKSTYVWTTIQRDAARLEDESGSGTGDVEP